MSMNPTGWCWWRTALLLFLQRIFSGVGEDEGFEEGR